MAAASVKLSCLPSAAGLNNISCSRLITCCFWMLLVLSTIHVPRAGSLSFNLSFSKPQSPADLDPLINRTGDTYLTTDTLELTRNSRDKSSSNSVGRATYTQPVWLWDAATGETASFTTTFVFRITLDPTAPSPGDGMAFFLGHVGSVTPLDPEVYGGGALGLLPHATNGTGDTTMVAVEFDTYQNQQLGDISGNHVAIDVNSLRSTASTNTTSRTRSLTSGYNMTATVRYENVTKFLAVELSVNGDTTYYVNATVDLKSYLPEHVAVGFSAATGDAGEQHQILSWSFMSTLQEAPAPPPLSEIQHPTNNRSSSSSSSSSARRRRTRTIIISVLAAVVGVFLLAGAPVVVLVLQQKRRRQDKQDNQRRRSSAGGAAPDETSRDDSDDDCEAEQQAELERGVAASGPRRYTYRELAAATDNFAEDGMLGRGGFGSVYRGTLVVSGEEHPVPVAIKMLSSSESSAQGRDQFESEVRIIGRLKHRNLVKLLGWCDSRRNGLMLVYELMPNGSLDKRLHGDGESFLTWPQRYHIILGLGSALRYLHEEYEQCVVHGDIKPSNIMLDESLGARLGDFGLARLGDHGARWRTTRAVMGTAGYIDPEFVTTQHPSTHADVYGFGIVLLEIVSGRCPVIPLEGGGAHFILAKWVWGLYGRNAILDAVDKRLRSADGDEADVDVRCMERVLVVGLWCAHPDQSERPSIAQAMLVLQSEDDARLPVLTPQMYRTVSEFAVTGRAIGALSIESSSSTAMTTGSHSKISSESASSALLRDSKELA